MSTKNSQNNRKSRLRGKLFGKKVKSHKLSISETSTEFFEEVPLYRGKNKHKTIKSHSVRSRKSKSTKA